MIPASPISRQSIRKPQQLLDMLGIDDLPLAKDLTFPLHVPPSYVAKMHKHDPQDPLLLQVLPLADEDVENPDFLLDPVGDLAATEQPGLLHKYHGRALLITTGACAIHCRYCFRRHFPYQQHSGGKDLWQGAIAQLRADSSIKEIILSGGDPLSLSDRRLAELIEQLESIPHLIRLRIHTRLPVVQPERISDALLTLLGGSRFQKVVVIHANHAQELDSSTAAAFKRLQLSGCTLLNQAVLLRHVNDNLNALLDLSQALFAQGVLPYYLHMLDRVQGAAHFEVEEAQAIALMAQLNARLPGYLVPKLVREISGEPNKTRIA